MTDIFTEIQDYLREYRQAEEDWLIAERIWEQWKDSEEYTWPELLAKVRELFGEEIAELLREYEV